MAMRAPGWADLRYLLQLIADEGLILYRGVEGVEQKDVDGAVGGSGCVVGEDAWGHPGHGRQLCCFGGCDGCVLFEVLDGLGDVVFEDGEVGGLEIVDGLALGVGDDDVDDDDLRAGLDGGDAAGWALVERESVRGRAKRGQERRSEEANAAWGLRRSNLIATQYALMRLWSSPEIVGFMRL